MAINLIKIIAVLAVAISYIQGHSLGKAQASAHYEKILSERDRLANDALVAAMDDQARLIQRASAIEREHIAQDEKVRIVYRNIEKRVTEYVDKSDGAGCSIDAAGLRIWNAANAGSDSSAEINSF